MKRSDVPSIALLQQLANEWFGARVKLERVTRGSSTYVFRMFLEHQTYYLRILPERDVSFEAEVNVLRVLKNNRVNVPNVIHYEQRNNSIGLSLMITEELLGYDLDQPGSVLERGNIRSILFHAGEQIALVNQVEVSGFGEIDRAVSEKLTGEHAAMRDYFYEFFEHDLSALHQYSLSERTISTTSRALEQGLKLINEQKSFLVHGDFDTSHIFHHDGAYSGLIDFGDIKAGSALYDLGHFKTHDFISGFEPLLAGYSNVKALSEQDKVEVTIWALFVAVRRLGMIHNRPRNFYHDHLTNALESIVAEIGNVL